MNGLARSLMPVVDAILAPVVDAILAPAVVPAALVLKAVRRIGVQRLVLCKRVLLGIGVFPIRNQYYEPLFDLRNLRKPLDAPRELPGIDWNVVGQLETLSTFKYAEELRGIPDRKQPDGVFHFNNGAFESGDAEYWYQIIRKRKPALIIEVGSGFSTLVARMAIERNLQENPSYRCNHICIEPYERPWLERTGVSVLRKRLEEVDRSLFLQLGRNDVLFIDSSHVIRPQGDVVLEYLELLPILRPGVIVHVHDVFSPRDYLRKWLVEDVKLWNEQYLLEAFLTSNHDWKIVGALNYLHHDHYEKLKAKSPYLNPNREPGSFYIEKL